MIEGESGLSASGLSEVSVTELRAALEAATRRQALLQQALVALRALEADGYPNVSPRFVDDAVLNEIREHIAAIESAFAQFSVMIHGSITFGEPVLK
ncbi:MAG: hypothetical protein ACREC4_02730 [Methylocella sp.]